MSIRTGFAAFLLAFACGGPWHTISFHDEGDLCFEQQGAAVAVVVSARECLSASCSRDVGGECSASLDGTTITITSEIFWEQNESPVASCTEDCGDASVTCSIADLPAGTYTVVHGEDEQPLVVPTDGSCPI
jgi:hypothetical protein